MCVWLLIIHVSPPYSFNSFFTSSKVYHGEAKKLLPGQKKTIIVVKQLKEGANKDERDTFLRPVEAMKYVEDRVTFIDLFNLLLYVVELHKWWSYSTRSSV